MTNKRKMFLAGFVARTELRQALEIASQHPLVNASTLCYFFEDGSRGNDVYIDVCTQPNRRCGAAHTDGQLTASPLARQVSHASKRGHSSEQCLWYVSIACAPPDWH